MESLILDRATRVRKLLICSECEGKTRVLTVKNSEWRLFAHGRGSPRSDYTYIPNSAPLIKEYPEAQADLRTMTIHIRSKTTVRKGLLRYNGVGRRVHFQAENVAAYTVERAS